MSAFRYLTNKCLEDGSWDGEKYANGEKHPENNTYTNDEYRINGSNQINGKSCADENASVNLDNYIGGRKLTNGHGHTNGKSHTKTLGSEISPSINGNPDALSPGNTFSPKASSANQQFWATELTNLPCPPPRCTFAKTATSGSNSSPRRHHVTATLDRDLIFGVSDLSAELGVTPAAFTFAALSIMLARTLDVDDDFFIALVLQQDPSRTDVSAPFLPLRVGPKLEEKASDVVRTAYAKHNVAVHHADVDMLAVLDHAVGSDKSWRELIPAGFSYELLPRDTASGPRHSSGAPTAWANNDTVTSFDLHLHIVESQDTACSYVSLSVPASLYTYFDAKSLVDRYLHVIRAMQADVSLQVKDCPLFDVAEGRRAVYLGKGPRIKFDEWPATLLHKIDAVACTVPRSIAVKDSQGDQLTYSEMLQRVGAIANALLQHNLSKGDRVAVYCEPSLDSLCSLLAITRIGCVYVPLDLRNPVERLESIVDDSSPSIIIFHGLTAQGVAGITRPGAELLNITTLSEKKIDTGSVPITSTRPDPAFVLYTSGSTGRPKGVLLSHGNFLGQIAAVHKEFGFTRERVLQQSSLGFDSSLHQIFVALTTGGTVIIARRDIRGDPVKLSELMLAERVTFTVGVPSEYSVLLRYGKAQLRQYCDWRYAVSGGERMSTALKQEFRSLEEFGPTLLSCYGPTEVALASSFGVLSYSDPELGADDENSPVGFTLPNYSVYVLDEKMRPVPQGFPGEVYIGGVGVACGYLHNEKLSKERFLPDPFADQEDTERGWTRMYRSGDKGRLLPDGSLSFLGRIDGDSQVKLRGIRIELEEVANVIVATSGGILHQAAVIVRGSAEHKYMVSWVTFSPGQQPDNTSSYLQKLLDSLPLPIYMRPVALLPLDNMPMNVNGKLDRRALSAKPIAEFQQNNADDDEVAGPTEKLLKQIWQEVIRPGSHSQDSFRFTLDSDFFQVGGNSILLVELQKRILDVFGKAIRWSDLFQVSVLRNMAARIDGKSGIAPSPTIDWTREIENCLDRVKQPIESDVEPAKEVLLTGSTGFLGRHLLQRLIDSPRVARIHAVAVRHHNLENEPNGATPRLVSIASPKLQLWQGDLRLPNLGLSTRDMAHLADTVDVVIHNGADVSFLKSYRSLHAPNVGSTIELCRLALKRNIPFHYVSSAGVLRLAHDLEAVGEISMAAYPPPSDGSDGYIASKWASEQLLEQVAEQLGLRVHIHRPTSITGEDVPETDVMANLLHFSRVMNAVPIFPGAHGIFNMVRVEDVVESILQEVLGTVRQRGLQSIDPDEYNGLHEAGLRRETGQVRWTHQAGATQIPVDGLGEYLRNEQGEVLRRVDLKDWVAAAIELGLNEKVASVLSTPEAARGHGLTIPRLL